MIYHLRTLGGVDLHAPDGREVRSILAQPKRLALLVYLALASAHRYRRRDTVVGLFWPELDQEHARGALRQALRFLRRELDDRLIVTRGEDEIGLDPGVVRCDALAFAEACEAGRADEALTMYRGDFLEGFFVSDAAPEFEQWLDQERTRLRQLASAAAWSVAEERRGSGDRAGASAMARRAVEFVQDHEGDSRRLIAFLDGLGDRAAALAVYEDFARRLKRDYDAEPAPETQALIQAVKDRTHARAMTPTDEERVPWVAPGAPPRERGARHRFRHRPRWALAVFALGGLFALAGYLVGFRVFRLGADRPLSVAVLPLEDLSGDTTQAYVAEGMTDQLITNLAQARGLQVINRRTMMEYRGSTKAPREIARELKADAVVLGAMQWLGDTVHMTAQLTLAGEDRAVWAQNYRGTRGDLLRMQGEIARAVAQRIRGASAPAQAGTFSAARPFDPEALDLYIKGRFWWNRRGQGLLRSIEFFDHALQLDPTFALAYSGMADAYVQLGYGGFLTPKDAFPKAREAARRALVLDSTLAEPHAALGYVHMYYEWDWTAADQQFRRALEMNPSYATGHEWYGLFLAAMGRFDDALTHERRAQELDPLSTAIGATAGWVLHYSGRDNDAARELKIALRGNPELAIARLYLGRVYQAQGQLDSALAQYGATGPLRSWVPTVAGEGSIYGQMGQRGHALGALHRLDSMSRTQYVTAYAMALVHTALGNADSAFVWLDRGVEERTHWLVWLNRDRRWLPLRSDPRFAALVERVGLPE